MVESRQEPPVRLSRGEKSASLRMFAGFRASHPQAASQKLEERGTVMKAEEAGSTWTRWTMRISPRRGAGLGAMVGPLEPGPTSLSVQGPDKNT